MGQVQLGVDVGVLAWMLGGVIVAGIVRAELIAYRVRVLEREKIELEKQVFALRTEMGTISDGLVGQLSEIKETLAWIKGRFSMLEETHTAGR